MSSFLDIGNACFFNVHFADFINDTYRSHLYTIDVQSNALTMHPSCDDMLIVGKSDDALLLKGQPKQSVLFTYAKYQRCTVHFYRKRKSTKAACRKRRKTTRKLKMV